MVGGGPAILGRTDPAGAKSPIFSRYSISCNTYIEKVQLTLIGSPLRAFQ